jgi:hypothetical protein
MGRGVWKEIVIWTKKKINAVKNTIREKKRRDCDREGDDKDCKRQCTGEKEEEERDNILEKERRKRTQEIGR